MLGRLFNMNSLFFLFLAKRDAQTQKKFILKRCSCLKRLTRMNRAKL